MLPVYFEHLLSHKSKFSSRTVRFIATYEQRITDYYGLTNDCSDICFSSVTYAVTVNIIHLTRSVFTDRWNYNFFRHFYTLFIFRNTAMLKTEVKLELELSCVRNFLLSHKVEEPAFFNVVLSWFIRDRRLKSSDYNENKLCNGRFITSVTQTVFHMTNTQTVNKMSSLFLQSGELLLIQRTQCALYLTCLDTIIFFVAYSFWLASF